MYFDFSLPKKYGLFVDTLDANSSPFIDGTLAKIIKVAAHEVLKDLGIKDPILKIAKSLEKEALNDPYFTSRKLYPNVDFYSGIIYKALNIPTEMFTVMFALGRVPGWIAHWREMRMNNDPIGRPRQIYTGSTHRDFISINNR